MDSPLRLFSVSPRTHLEQVERQIVFQLHIILQNTLAFWCFILSFVFGLAYFVCLFAC